jgi:hypothetical protein
MVLLQKTIFKKNNTNQNHAIILNLVEKYKINLKLNLIIISFIAIIFYN